ncbi:hypothetical protein AAFF_G00132780 [Aldrovandia affinis]|uniref:Uncharacterized protein n=1 Tax=Aldrovandia affinis TaxID=143900 RepID=A0AAD7RQN8_9TELE|nr:hypothetical protein AAFF_G00132780 [Aldrovandia affinis]
MERGREEVQTTLPDFRGGGQTGDGREMDRRTGPPVLAALQSGNKVLEKRRNLKLRAVKHCVRAQRRYGGMLLAQLNRGSEGPGLFTTANKSWRYRRRADLSETSDPCTTPHDPA